MSKEFFIWRDNFSVGNQIIDDQHKKLIAIINRLYQSYMDKKQVDEISSIMKELADYTRYHFTTEENLIREKKYPFIAEHIKEHDFFIEELRNFKEQFDSSPSILTLKVMTFLQKWLRDHILVNDQKYKEYIIK
ncbi:MAG: bacteriohemerythrin [Salinivirgaceae bacterium]|nr:bacteriohemerythrin [Salinivirgaceae bacterium]